MALKGTPNSGKSKPSRGIRAAQAGASAPAPKALGNKPAAKAPGGNNRTLWLILGGLALLALCCVCSGFIAWNFGDQAVDFFRSLNIQ
jgi:hypothetical protein